MKIKLKKMQISNFKGIKGLEICFDDVTNIRGTNGVGKTTIFDAFCWCLFGKDSHEVAKFDIKPIRNGEVVSGVDSIVKIELSVDGFPIIFERNYHEVWKTPKGSIEKVFDKHEVKYAINEVPVKAKQYEDKVNEILDSKTFKLLTNPYAFTSQKADIQRKILFEVLGENSDEEVIKSNVKLNDLLSMLENKTMEELKAETKATISMLNKKKAEIPIKINELENMKVDEDTTEIVNRIKELREKRAEHIDIIEKSNEVKAMHQRRKMELTEKENKVNKEYQTEKDKISEMERKRSQKLMEASKNANKPKEEAYKVYVNKKEEMNNVKHSIDKLESNLAYEKENMAKYRTNIDNLVADLKAVESNEYVYKGETICPHCGAEIKAEKINSIKAREEVKFNKQKTDSIAKIKAEGKQFQELYVNLKTKIQSEEKSLEVLKETLKFLETETNEAYASWQNIKESTISYPGIEEDEKNIVLAKENLKNKFDKVISEIRAEEEEISNITMVDITSHNEEIVNIDKNIKELEKELSKVERNSEIDERINKHLDEEREISIKIAELQRKEFLCDEFVRSKVKLVEDKIANKFKYISFKLFRTFLSSDNVEECCEATVNGVPYNNNVNTAAKINAGLEIINVLSEHYGVQAPIFIDNAECCVEYIPTESQIIKLYVDENYKNMEVAYGR